MTNYSELLKHYDWKLKRKVILKRDFYTCQHCFNKELIKTANKKMFAGFMPLNRNLYQIGLNNPDSPHERYKIALLDRTVFEKYIDEKEVIIYSEKVDDYNEKVVSIGEEVNGSFKASFTVGLHVHHKFYQENLLPWEYPDTALISLCWNCHEKLHANTKVPWFDASGNVIGNLTPCKRCHGAGNFPEFRHIEAGICFHCAGAKFEELISNDYSQKDDGD